MITTEEKLTEESMLALLREVIHTSVNLVITVEKIYKCNDRELDFCVEYEDVDDPIQLIVTNPQSNPHISSFQYDGSQVTLTLEGRIVYTRGGINTSTRCCSLEDLIHCMHNDGWFCCRLETKLEGFVAAV